MSSRIVLAALILGRSGSAMLSQPQPQHVLTNRLIVSMLAGNVAEHANVVTLTRPQASPVLAPSHWTPLHHEAWFDASGVDLETTLTGEVLVTGQDSTLPSPRELVHSNSRDLSIRTRVGIVVPVLLADVTPRHEDLAHGLTASGRDGHFRLASTITPNAGLGEFGHGTKVGRDAVG